MATGVWVLAEGWASQRIVAFGEDATELKMLIGSN